MHFKLWRLVVVKNIQRLRSNTALRDHGSFCLHVGGQCPISNHDEARAHPVSCMWLLCAWCTAVGLDRVMLYRLHGSITHTHRTWDYEKIGWPSSLGRCRCIMCIQWFTAKDYRGKSDQSKMLFLARCKPISVFKTKETSKNIFFLTRKVQK